MVRRVISRTNIVVGMIRCAFVAAQQKLFALSVMLSQEIRVFGTFNKALPVLKFSFPDGHRIVSIADGRFQFIDDPLSGCFATKPLVRHLILRLQIASNVSR